MCQPTARLPRGWDRGTLEHLHCLNECPDALPRRISRIGMNTIVDVRVVLALLDNRSITHRGILPPRALGQALSRNAPRRPMPLTPTGHRLAQISPLNTA